MDRQFDHAAVLALDDAAVLALGDVEAGDAHGRAAAILDAAAIRRPAAGWDAIALGRRDRAVLAVRAATVGSAMELVLSCPGCGALLELVVDPVGLIADTPAVDHFTVEAGSVTVTGRPLTADDLQRAGAALDVDEARAALVACCVVEARRGGEVIAGADLDDEAVGALAAALEAADPGADVGFAITCTDCGATVDASLDVVAFVWTELSRRAMSLLDEVDVLAQRYGWTEGEILALPAGRRRRYLELAS